MAVVQAILALLTRSAGRVINTAFGWAATILFGKVPADRQIYISGITFGSVLWLTLGIGAIFPKAGAFLIAFVPLSEGHEGWVHLDLPRGADRVNAQGLPRWPFHDLELTSEGLRSK